MVIFPLNMVIFPLNMVIFHCYVSLPEGNKLELPDFFWKCGRWLIKKQLKWWREKGLSKNRSTNFLGTSARKPWVLAPKMKCGPKIKTRIYRNRNAFFGGGKHILWVGHYWGTKKATDMAWSKFIILDTSIAFMVQKVLVIVRSLLENKIPKIPKILKILRYPSRILGYLEVSLKNNGTTHFSPPMAQK